MRWFVVLLLFASCLIAYAQDAVEPPEWTFDDRDAEKEIETWGAVNQLKPLKIDEVKDGSGQKRKVLLTESTGPDPYFFPGGEWNVANYEPFSGADYHTLYLGVRVNVANTWQIYYVTKEDTNWGEVQRQNFEVAATDDFQDLQIEVERGGWQDHTVLRFRIDPGTTAGVKAEIDYISFRGVPGGVQSVQPEGKLATTWAMLRSRR